MIRSVNKYQISEIFSTEKVVIYNIPRYQREYTWGTLQWEELFEDINENDSGYFLGSIICIDQSTDALQHSKLEVVDGQQRLTTLSLLFAAIYSQLNKFSSTDDSVKNKAYKLRNRLLLEDSNEILRLTPQQQNNNLNDYLSLLHGLGLISDKEKQPNAGNRKIYRAYKYFEKRLIELTEGADGQGKLVAFLNKVYESCLVKIEVLSHADAYTLFETLNNRGAPLTAVDLIKNKLLSQLERNNQGNLDQYFSRWNRLITQLGDDYSVQERFFRQYYNSFKNELNASFRTNGGPKDPLGPVATRSNLIQIYEELINDAPEQFLENLYQASCCYSRMLSTQQSEFPSSLNDTLQDIDHVQAAPAYVLLLNLISHKNKYQIIDSDLENITKLLVSFFVRRNITDTPPTRALTRLFMKIIDRIEDQTGPNIRRIILEELKSVSADDDTFRSKLEGPIYEENSGITRFVLCYLAERGMTNEYDSDLWKKDGKQYVWTIEHIFPQGENIPDEWVQMIADGDRNLAVSRQRQYVHTLGNLTITGYNSALGNKSFEEKRDRTDRNGNPVGFNNKLNLNAELASSTSWTVEQIKNRTSNLTNKIMAEFNLMNV